MPDKPAAERLFEDYSHELLLETANYLRNEVLLLRKALEEFPKMPDPITLKHLSILGRSRENWERGKKIQQRLMNEEGLVALKVIPFKTECEEGAGFWDRITQGAWREVGIAPEVKGTPPDAS